MNNRGGAPPPPPPFQQFQWLGVSIYPSSVDRDGSSMPGAVGPSWPLAATAYEMPTTPMRPYPEVAAQPSPYPWPGASPYQLSPSAASPHQQLPLFVASPHQQLRPPAASPYHHLPPYHHQHLSAASPHQQLRPSPYHHLPPSAATRQRSVYPQFAAPATPPVSPHAGGPLSAFAFPFRPPEGPHDQEYPHELNMAGSQDYRDDMELKERFEHVIPQAASYIPHGVQARGSLAADLVSTVDTLLSLLQSDGLDGMNLLEQALGEAIEQRLSPPHRHNILQHHYQEDPHRQAGITPAMNSKHKSEQSLPQLRSRGYQKEQPQAPLVSHDLPKVLMQFSEYKKSHPLTEKVKMYDGTLQPECSSDGRFCIRSYMDDMFGTHEEGLSWGGNFSKDDLVWDPDTGHFFINKKPELPATADNVLNDTYRLGEDLLESFGKGNPSQQPHYMAHLHDMMTNPPGVVWTSEPAMKKYIVFIRAHPAFALPMSRLQLLIGIFCVYDAADFTERKSLRRVINLWCRQSNDWREKVELHPFLSKRFHHKDVVEPTKGGTKSETKEDTNNEGKIETEGGGKPQGDSNGEVNNEDPTKGVKSRYSHQPVSLLEFLRHCGVHGYEGTRVKDVNGDKQLLESFEEMDILLALFFPFFIADLVFYFVQYHDSFKRFEAVWNSYAKVEVKELQLVPKSCKTICTS